MPANPTTQRMGERHEEFLAEINGGTKTKSSGNQWHDQGDGRDAHDAPFAFCWDGKSTRGKQIAVTLDMIAKIREQAQGERPQIGLRWYGNDALDKVTEDWIAITAADFAEMKQDARLWAAVTAILGDTTPGGIEALLREYGQKVEDSARLARELEEVTRQRDLEGSNGLNLARELESVKHRLRQEVDSALAYRRDLEQSRNSYARAMELLAEARSAAEAPADTGTDDPGRQSVESLQQILKAVEADRDRYRELATAAQRGRLIPPHVPRLPWTVVFQLKLDGRVEGSGIHYASDGVLTPFEVSTVRVERSLDSANRPRLIVNDARVSSGDLYIDGKLLARACADDASIEEG